MSLSIQTMRIGRVRSTMNNLFDPDEVIQLATEAKAVGARLAVENTLGKDELCFEKELRT